ncbi:MAG: hypothetical protein HOP18_15915 [Deltaproteobacteria bacterium]|nr:hypothetical protein [Deltaproteobacteria bacterium]
MLNHTLLHTLSRVVLLVGALLFSLPTLAVAGCGCEKPPPAPASVRPNATYGGMPVTMFGSGITTGQLYTVTFTAMNGTATTVSSVAAVSKRDLADGVYKAQLIVTVPSSLPLGPVGITVKRAGQTVILLSIPDTSFTVAPQPISVPAQVGEFHYQNFQFAVSRAGVVYLSLNLNSVTLPMVFQGQAKGYPLRFSSDDIVFYNTQGFLMQLLNQNMPGLGSTVSSSGNDSDTLHYSRHEFTTFYLEHDERQAHSMDPTDANWHLDGSRHIDHDHLVLAITGKMNGNGPVPGATPAFELVFKTFSLFHHGLVGASSINMSNAATTDSYNSITNLSGTDGDLRSNGSINLTNAAFVNGDATAASFSVTNGAVITGTKTTTSQALDFMPISVPKELQNLGNIVRTNSKTYTLVGPASYKVGKIDLSNDARLIIDNANGPVTLYVTQNVTTTNSARITTTDTNPENFALYMVNGGDVTLTNAGTFYGVVYGPQSLINFTNGGQFNGAFVGKSVTLNNGAQVHYDTALRGE